MEVYSDFVLVKVDSELETFAGMIKDDKGNEIKLILNPNFRPTHHSKISARVISSPRRLSGKDNPLYEIYPGSPRPLSYRGHDYIKSVMDDIPIRYQKNHVVPYQCGMFRPKMQTHADVQVDIEPGDTVYFHYNTLLNEQNYLYRDMRDGMLVYRVPYGSIYCRVRKQKITMLNAFVLVSEIYDDEVVDIEVDGRTVKGKMHGNLVASIGERPKYLSGILRHIGEGIGPDRRDIPVGTHVVFRPSSEFVNMIEGEAFYVMRHWDIVASWIPDSEIDELRHKPGFEMFERNFWIRPEGDYVMVRPNPIKMGKNTRIFDPKAIIQKFKQGEIFLLPGTVKDNKKRKVFSYGVGKVIDSGVLCDINNKEVYYEKGPHYVYIEEYDLGFVRAGDVFGEHTSGSVSTVGEPGGSSEEVLQ